VTINNCAIIIDKKLKSYHVQDKKYTSGFFNDASSILERYLKSHGIESEGIFGMNKTIRYKESILEKGEKITVLGKGEWRSADQVDLPDHYEKVLSINPTGDDFIYISDEPDITKDKAIKSHSKRSRYAKD
jgi:hypothetical protein